MSSSSGSVSSSSSSSSSSRSSGSSTEGTFSGSGSDLRRSVRSGSSSGSRASVSDDGGLRGLMNAASEVGTLVVRGLAPGASGGTGGNYDNAPVRDGSDSSSASSSSDGSSSSSSSSSVSPNSSDDDEGGAISDGESSNSSSVTPDSEPDSLIVDTLRGLHQGDPKKSKKGNQGDLDSYDSSDTTGFVGVEVSVGSGSTSSSTRSAGTSSVDGAKRSASGTIKFGAACCCVSLAVAATYIYATNMEPIVNPFIATWSAVFVMLIGLCVALVGCVMACCYRSSDRGETALPGAMA